MEHQNESARNDAISAAETQLIALIAAIAVEQVIAEPSQQPHIQQEGATA
ncbi:hypothetical protein [Aromatoleum petrolei]|uniref:Uncharacterized protein n=1 Tax=Aromatoleum petrolei TaxID=76116 RepID=A0ABX1MWN7_9RHOO|nr:hypothetical protein [Aromatoleum petrolei]NMF90731.1 hypothetical protein [Aromatoleum petrolei]QTQ38396.1 Uncharacterized protein ToN1_42970 [Aromatoleum petrolei]